MNHSNFRILCAVFALLFLLTVLAACSKEQGPEAPTEESTEKPIVQIPYAISDYTLIRPETDSSIIVQRASDLKQEIDKLTGSKISIKSDWIKNPDEIPEDAKEILLGATNRQESEAALEGVDDNSFVVMVEGNRIIINARLDSMLDIAVEYFLNTYVRPTAGEGAFTLPEALKFVSPKYEAVAVALDGKSEFKIVYSEDLNNEGQTNSSGKTIYDYPVQVAMDLRSGLQEALASKDFSLSDDWVKKGSEPSAESYEILIGRTNRKESSDFLNTLAPNEYGYSVIGRKIVVTGWSDTTVKMASELFLATVKNGMIRGEGGAFSFTMMQGAKSVAAYTNWNADIPLPSKYATLSGVLEGMKKAYEAYYTDATAEEFASYCKDIEAAGYTLYFENEAAGNLFATYTSKETMIHTYYVQNLGAIRVVTEPMRDVSLPNVEEESFTKVTDLKLTQMRLDYASGNFGMCYIITLEDGSFVIYDGGGSTGSDCTRLYNVLKELNESPDGKIHIAAWVITHPHWDHVVNFINFAKQRRSEVVLETCISNIGAEVVVWNSYNPNYYINSGHSSNQIDSLRSMMPNMKMVTVHTGQVVKIRNIELEILYTIEDLYPVRLDFFNDVSMITRMKLGDQTVMFLGDVERKGSDACLQMFGSYLKSDVVQVSHHGHNGATQELYQAVAPSMLLWPAEQSVYKDQTGPNGGGWYHAVDRFIVGMASVKEIYVADIYNYTFVLPYEIGSGNVGKTET